jgi:hypothetical protein
MGCWGDVTEVGDKDDIRYDDTTVERGKMTTWKGSKGPKKATFEVRT